MLNQAAVEALHSATYIENYLDYVENLPDELQRCISRVRELDLTFNGFLKEVEQLRDALLLEVESNAKKKSYLSKVQQALICAQELGDEKLQILQQVQDIIENKTRQLDLDYRNLGKESEPAETTVKEIGTARELATLAAFGAVASINNGGEKGGGGERQSKRVRRNRTEIAATVETVAVLESVPTPEPVRQVQQTVQQSTPTNTLSSGSQKKTGTGSIGKKKKRKSRQTTQRDSGAGTGASAVSSGGGGRDSLRDREESPARDDEMNVDPDEPTYCLCDQISYGEMIMCDNDLCPYEWFHFSCVSLGVKPKGKWYCPKCRGDRSSVMKPKAQFMKELERLKMEKEIKDEKGS